MTRKSHNCVGIAFIQGDSAGGSKLIEQTIPLREGEEEGVGSNTFQVPFLELFVHSRSYFSNLLSAQGPILKFLTILDQNFFICPLQGN